MSNDNAEKLQSALFVQRPIGIAEADWNNRLFDQYKLYVDLMDKVTERRNAANTLFLTTNSGLITFFVAVIALLPDLNLPFDPIEIALLAFVIAICGITLSVLWFLLIQNYRKLSIGKFAVINALEERFPARLFAAEWIGIGEGKNRYTPLSILESLMPIFFIGMYLFVLVVSVSLLTRQADMPNIPANSVTVTVTAETVINPLPTHTP
jgi:hypothetical protein